MINRKNTTAWIIVLVGLGAALSIVLWYRRQPVVLRGAVLRENQDANKQVPLADTEITAIDALGSHTTKSNPSGFFRLALAKGLRRYQPVTLQFRRAGYQPLDLDDSIGDKLYIARMVPIRQDTDTAAGLAISNARIRYSVKTASETNVGTAVKTFQIVNVGNTPCNGRPPCSVGGIWKAGDGSVTLDAGEGNELRNPRVSCIAGPCPFTKIERQDLSPERRHFYLSVRDWSDTATFLVEAEVFHRMTSDTVRVSYPVIFGRTMDFSLPAEAEGPSIEAEINKELIVFPLGPDLFLSWADCRSEADKNQSKTYRCELKPGYRFQ